MRIFTVRCDVITLPTTYGKAFCRSRKHCDVVQNTKGIIDRERACSKSLWESRPSGCYQGNGEGWSLEGMNEEARNHVGSSVFSVVSLFRSFCTMVNNTILISQIVTLISLNGVSKSDLFALLTWLTLKSTLKFSLPFNTLTFSLP